jgi:hypothetical protein
MYVELHGMKGFNIIDAKQAKSTTDDDPVRVETLLV